MVEVLSREIILLLQTLGEVAQETGCHAYAVGGFVRDLLLHIKNLDLDVVIEGDGLAYAKKLGKKLGGKVRTHEKFGTAVVKLPDEPRPVPAGMSAMLVISIDTPSSPASWSASRRSCAGARTMRSKA